MGYKRSSFQSASFTVIGGTLKIPRDLESLHSDLPPFRLASLTLFCKWQQILDLLPSLPSYDRLFVY